MTIYDNIFQGTASALADLALPIFDNDSAEEVEKAFASVFSFSGVDEDWLCWLVARIVQISKGKTRAQAVEASDAPIQIKSPVVVYLRLERGNTRKFAAIGPFRQPIQFLD